jgi:hypothetical protein
MAIRNKNTGGARKLVAGEKGKKVTPRIMAKTVNLSYKPNQSSRLKTLDEEFRAKLRIDESSKKISYSLGICKDCGNRTKKKANGRHEHALYPMGHPANPRKAS